MGALETKAVVMKRTVAFAAVMVISVLVNNSQAGVSLVMNGSFEQDGVISDVAAQPPRFWCDVNIPLGKFGAKIDTIWATHGYAAGYSLKFYSASNRTFAAGDMVSVSQQVHLTDAKEIIFDIKLNGTHSLFPWDPEKFSAVVQIDGRDVWDSNVLGPAGNAEYHDVIIILDDMGTNDSIQYVDTFGKIVAFKAGIVKMCFCMLRQNQLLNQRYCRLRRNSPPTWS